MKQRTVMSRRLHHDHRKNRIEENAWLGTLTKAELIREFVALRDCVRASSDAYLEWALPYLRRRFCVPRKGASPREERG